MAPGEGGPGFEAWPIGSRVRVADGPLNLRSEPFGTIVGSYSTGSLATVTGEPRKPATGDGILWYPVRTDRGEDGWFAAEFLELTDDSGGSEVRVADGPLNVRSQPGTSGEIIATVPTGATGAITDKMPEEANGYVWVNVKFHNQHATTGWVAQDFLEWI